MHRWQRGSTGGGGPAHYGCRHACHAAFAYFYSWLEKPSLLAKLVYSEDDVIFISVNKEVQFHNFSNVSNGLC